MDEASRISNMAGKWVLSSMDGFPTQTSIGDYSNLFHSVYMIFPCLLGFPSWISQLATIQKWPEGYCHRGAPRDPAKALEISLSHFGPWRSLGFMSVVSLWIYLRVHHLYELNKSWVLWYSPHIYIHIQESKTGRWNTFSESKSAEHENLQFICSNT